MSNPGRLYILAAPSGAGKTSLSKALAASLTDLKISVSHTTRPQRPHDVEGRDYYFIDTAQFDSMVTHQQFLEYATVYGYYYGTSRAWVLSQLREGIDVILEIDWQGARQIKQHFSAAVSIFILPPSLSALQQRLMARGEDSDEVIADRMMAAHQELAHYHEFDYLVINDDFEVALTELQTIVYAHRLQLVPQQSRYQALLAELTQTA